jgi:transposase
MTHYVGLDISQKTTAVRVVDDNGVRLWRGECASRPEQIARILRQHAGSGTRIGIGTGSMTSWLIHDLRSCTRRCLS